jgi:hypothetical protein
MFRFHFDVVQEIGQYKEDFVVEVICEPRKIDFVVHYFRQFIIIIIIIIIIINIIIIFFPYDLKWFTILPQPFGNCPLSCAEYKPQ